MYHASILNYSLFNTHFIPSYQMYSKHLCLPNIDDFWMWHCQLHNNITCVRGPVQYHLISPCKTHLSFIDRFHVLGKCISNTHSLNTTSNYQYHTLTDMYTVCILKVRFKGLIKPPKVAFQKVIHLLQQHHHLYSITCHKQLWFLILSFSLNHLIHVNYHK